MLSRLTKAVKVASLPDITQEAEDIGFERWSTIEKLSSFLFAAHHFEYCGSINGECMYVRKRDDRASLSCKVLIR
jgi:hypothetical protein